MSYGLFILFFFSVIIMVLLFRKPLASLYTHISILVKELRSRFAALFGIPVEFFFFGIVLSSVFFYVLCMTLSILFLLKKTKQECK